MSDGLSSSDKELLVRIDERTKNIEERLDLFVTKEAFIPVRALIYGLATLTLITVVGGVLATIIKT